MSNNHHTATRIVVQMRQPGASSHQVVVDLILDMKKLGHPSFVKLVDKEVQEKAAELPEDGVPPEVVQIFKEELGNDDAPLDSKLQPQKAATPCEALEHDIASAGAAFSTQRPRTVVAEGEARRDAHQADELALENMITELGSDGIRSGLQTFEVRAGNQLIDMFRACYWAIAFCFLFKHATAEPDVVNTVATGEEQAKATSRRKKGNQDAPDVDIQAWGPATLRQAASQFRRDWNFAPALWNFLFRTRVNQMPNASAYIYVNQENGADGHRTMTPKEIEQGAQEIYRKLRQGVYVDVNNQNKAINGDLSKLRYVPGLSAAAQKLLSNAEARTKTIPGTHAVRSTMRHQTHAYRVNYGLAIFITFSPSERDSTIMVRMVRARRGDPAIGEDRSKAFYGRNKPNLAEEFFRLSPERLAEAGARADFVIVRLYSSTLYVGPNERTPRKPGVYLFIEGNSVRSCPTTSPDVPCWRETRWLASMAFKSWSASPFGTSLACGFALAVLTVRNRVHHARMLLAATQPPEAVCLGASTQPTDLWNVRRMATTIFMANSSCNACTNSRR